MQLLIMLARVWCSLVILLISLITSFGQVPLTTSKYGLPVVKTVQTYKQLVLKDGDNALVDVRTLIPDAHFDVRYATTNNLIGRKLYPRAEVFMRRPAASALVRANELLRAKGFGLLLHDGYRPYAITELFYEVIKDTTYVADPRKGSKHNRGMAIDLSLFHLHNGQPVLMPSAYDETTPRAWHNYTETTEEAHRHREILKQVMTQVGFEIYPWEWWHYDYQGWQTCYTYDIWHKKIKKANRRLTKVN